MKRLTKIQKSHRYFFSFSFFVNLLIFFLLPLINLAHAGREIGNGGHTIVCSTFSNSNSESLELYDLYEASKLHIPRLTIFKDTQTPYTDQITTALKKIELIHPSFALTLKQELLLIIKKSNFVTDQKLTFINDGGYFSVPENCDILQLANYTEKEEYELLISASLFNKLSETDKAALYLHEAIYKLDRQMGKTSSIDARKLVGYLFSSSTIPTALIQSRALFFENNIVDQGPFVYSRLINVFNNLRLQSISQPQITKLSDLEGKWQLWGKLNKDQENLRYLYRGARYERFLTFDSAKGTATFSDRVLDDGLNFVEKITSTLKQNLSPEKTLILKGKPDKTEYDYECVLKKETIFVTEQKILLCQMHKKVNQREIESESKLVIFISLDPNERI